ncbi:uncharacterized protein [Nicotiana sylvestris]|uniref:uncharacterized protein n=1 Tax=Nicotiana sylvestris TaxID=4096 RepID=UPI00388C98E0
MTNPQDNPGTPPQPTPSDSFTSPQPSTTPQPRRRRVKILARKTVATGELSKKLNAKLKASQAQDSENSDDSFKSTSEGEGTGSSDSEKAQNPPSKVRSVLVENLDNRFVLVRSVMNMEMPESRRRGGKNKSEKEKESEGVSSDVRGKGKEVDESSPTSKMTLADLLKKADASYNPKKRRTSTPKAHITTKTTKKRKATSPTTTEIPLPKGRTTRSKLKQSEDELQKAMAESKKKIMDKGKAKVAEPVETVDVDRMDPIHQDEHVTVNVEVQIPKPKKTTASSKKSSSVSKAVEPSFLAKRTRSAAKAKQVNITEEED